MKSLLAGALVALILYSGCGTDPDTRPETAAYIIEAILKPSCGRAACHSSETRARDIAFDTIAQGIAAMKTSQRGERLVVAGSPDTSRLFTILTDSQRIMPPDVPLAQADIDLIGRWITDGAAGLQ